MEDGSNALGYAVVAALGLLILTGAVVTAAKNKLIFFVLGFLVQLFWYVGAIRLAKPDSWWARRFYDEDKMVRARQRFGANADAAAVRETDAMR